VRIPDNGRLRDILVRDQRALDFRCAHPVAGAGEDVADAARDPAITGRLAP